MFKFYTQVLCQYVEFVELGMYAQNKFLTFTPSKANIEQFSCPRTAITVNYVGFQSWENCENIIINYFQT